MEILANSIAFKVTNREEQVLFFFERIIHNWWRFCIAVEVSNNKLLEAIFSEHRVHSGVKASALLLKCPSRNWEIDRVEYSYGSEHAIVDSVNIKRGVRSSTHAILEIREGMKDLDIAQFYSI